MLMPAIVAFLYAEICIYYGAILESKKILSVNTKSKMFGERKVLSMSIDQRRNLRQSREIYI